MDDDDIYDAHALTPDLSDADCLEIASQLWGLGGIADTVQMIHSMGVATVHDVYLETLRVLTEEQFAAQSRAIDYLAASAGY